MPHPRWFIALGILTGAVVIGSAVSAGVASYGFLLWNLVLAWIPVLLGLALRRLAAARASMVVLAPLVALWLLFLPNAPYLVTDLVHIGEAPHPLGLAADAVVLSVAALAGVVAGVLALALVESAIRQRFGALASRLTVCVAIPLASLGVYLGRVLRWNSWDALLDPRSVGGQLLDALRDPAAHAQGIVFVCAFAVFLGVAYALYKRIPAPRCARRDSNPRPAA